MKEKQQFKIWVEGNELHLELIHEDGTRTMKKYEKRGTLHAKIGYNWNNSLQERGFEIFAEGTREVQR